MAYKTFFYAIAFLILFSSCASEDGETKNAESENQNNSSNSESIKKIFLGDSKNAATRKSSVSSNSINQLNINLNDTLNLVTNNTGDEWNSIGSTISNNTYPHSFVKVTPISGDFSAINYADNSGIIETYIVLTNDIAIGLSRYGLPQNNSGNLKSNSKIYSRINHYYYKSANNLKYLEINLSGDVIDSILTNDIQNFEIAKNFIRFEKSDGHYIKTFANENTFKMSDLDWMYNAGIKNNYVFKMNDDCLIIGTDNSSAGDEYQKLCISEQGGFEITNARQGLRDCYNDNTITWCDAVGSEVEVLNTSLNNCSHVDIDDGFLACNRSGSPQFWDLNNNERNQLERVTSYGSSHVTINQYFSFDSEFVYMISGNDGALNFSKIDLKAQTATQIDVSSYTKPNWIEYCDGVVDLSIDDKFLKYYPNTGNLVEIGSNEGIEEYECIE
jgi:hypothetical protein